MSFDVCRENVDELFLTALENQKIRVLYQPKYDALNGKYVKNPSAEDFLAITLSRPLE